MFHHFHDEFRHAKSQGSISKNTFIKLIHAVGRENIINADEFIKRLKNKTLKKEICLTFDDGLKSQLDIALPVLKKFKIKAFFFIYTSIFTQKPDLLEIYRYFRTVKYKNTNFFYEDFYKYCDLNIINFFKKNKKKIKKIKKQIPFYSIEDIKFRLVRDEFLSKSNYSQIMYKLFREKKFNYKKIFNKLFITKYDLLYLQKEGHQIGLHSHNHPTNMSSLKYNEQRKEYKDNIKYLYKILINKPNINSMSHPCGSYNLNTLAILKKINIEIGFRQMLKKNLNYKKFRINQSNLEIAREDHSNIVKKFNL
jgi:peptidoglycan/xylan/chitin deacetylase (PgdA/CDA1 family)